MRKLTLGFLFPFLLLQFSYAQLYEKAVPMSIGNNNALTLILPKVSVKDAEKVWQHFMDDVYHTNAKWNRQTGEWIISDAEIAPLGGEKPVNLYTSFEQFGEGVNVHLWIILDGEFLTSLESPEQFVQAEKLMMRYALEMAKATILEELEVEEKELERMETDLRKLKNAYDRYQEELEKTQTGKEEVEKKIVKNIRDQEVMNKNITQQKLLLDQIHKKLNDL